MINHGYPLAMVDAAGNPPAQNLVNKACHARPWIFSCGAVVHELGELPSGKMRRLAGT